MPKALKSCPNSKNRPIWSHCCSSSIVNVVKQVFIWSKWNYLLSPSSLCQNRSKCVWASERSWTFCHLFKFGTFEKGGPFSASFSLSSIQYSWQKTNTQYKFCRWVDSNLWCWKQPFCQPLCHNHCPSLEAFNEAFHLNKNCLMDLTPV